LRSAWSQLGGSAEIAKAAPDNELVAFNKQQRADKQPEIKLK
jgi:hypothetical protein